MASTTPVMIWIFPAEWGYLVPALTCSLMIGLTQFLGVAIVVARILGIHLAAVCAPLAKPLVLSLIAMPLLIAFNQSVENWVLWKLLGLMFVYGGIYLVLCWFFMLEKNERAQFMGLIQKIRSRNKPSDSSENSTSSVNP